MIALPDTDEDSLLDLDATMAAELARRKKEERPDLVGLLKIQRLFFEMGKISTRCGNCNHPRVSHVDGEGPCSECDCQRFEPKPLDDARVASILRSSGFPRPWLTLPRGRLWLRSDVIEWTESWTQKPGRPHKPRRKARAEPLEGLKAERHFLDDQEVTKDGHPIVDGQAVDVTEQEPVTEAPAEEPDFLEQEIAERTARNPDYPRLLAEAEEQLAARRREEEVPGEAEEPPEPEPPPSPPSVRCPSCGYELNLSNEEASQLPEAKVVLRCPNCRWLGQFWRSPLKLI